MKPKDKVYTIARNRVSSVLDLENVSVGDVPKAPQVGKGLAFFKDICLSEDMVAYLGLPVLNGRAHVMRAAYRRENSEGAFKLDGLTFGVLSENDPMAECIYGQGYGIYVIGRCLISDSGESCGAPR